MIDWQWCAFVRSSDSGSAGWHVDEAEELFVSVSTKLEHLPAIGILRGNWQEEREAGNGGRLPLKQSRQILDDAELWLA